MEVANILFVVVVACVLWSVVSLVLLTAALDRRGVKAPFPFMGVLLFRNVSRYRELTRKEAGRVGGLFYSCVVPINAALVLYIVSLLVRGAK